MQCTLQPRAVQASELVNISEREFRETINSIITGPSLLYEGRATIVNRGMTNEDESIRITEQDLPQEFVLKLLGRHEARGLWGIKNTRAPVDFMVRYAKTHELSLPIVQLVVTKEGIFMSPIQCRLDNQSKERISIRKLNPRPHSDRRFVGTRVSENETWNDEKVTKPQVKPCNIAQAVLKQMKQNYGKYDNSGQENMFKCFGTKKPEEKKLGPPTDLQLLSKYSHFDWRRRGIFFFGIDTISYGVQDLIFTRVFSMIVVSDTQKTPDTARSPFMCHAFVCESRSTARRVTYALAAAFHAYGRSMKHLRGNEKPPKKLLEEQPRRLIMELRPHMEGVPNDSEA